jgi:hypothetical protein
VEAPRAHCVDIVGAIEGLAGILPFVKGLIDEYGDSVVEIIIGYVLTKLGGRTKESNDNLNELINLIKEMDRNRLQEGKQRDEFYLALTDRFLELPERLRVPARQAVAPIGRNCSTLAIPRHDGRPTTVIDVPMAEAIRAKVPLLVDDPMAFEVHVDTVSISKRAMKVIVLPDGVSLVDVAVRDPAFDESPDDNIYTRSLGKTLTIHGKAVRDAETNCIVKIHASHAIEGDDGA